MAREKKENVPVSIRMEKQTYDRLAKFCEESGQPKTVAIERAVNLYINAHDEEQRQLKDAKKQDIVNG